jgi:DNA-binding NarL/FixJ family response regulator
MSKTEKIKIGLIDSYTLFRQGLKLILEMNSRYEIIFDVPNGKEAVIILKYTAQPDILIGDFNILDIDGIQTFNLLNDNNIESRIVVISRLGDDESKLNLVEHGARAILDKEISYEDLWKAIDTVYEKGWCLKEQLVEQIIRRKKNAITKNNALTTTEKKLLYYLCKELTHAEIAKKMFLSVRTIDDYSNKLIKKLKVRNKAGLIVYAIKNSFDNLVMSSNI